MSHVPIRLIHKIKHHIWCEVVYCLWEEWSIFAYLVVEICKLYYYIKNHRTAHTQLYVCFVYYICIISNSRKSSTVLFLWTMGFHNTYSLFSTLEILNWILENKNQNQPLLTRFSTVYPSSLLSCVYLAPPLLRKVTNDSCRFTWAQVSAWTGMETSCSQIWYICTRHGLWISMTSKHTHSSSVSLYDWGGGRKW